MPLKNVLKSFPEKSFVDLIDDTPSTEYSATLVARHLLLLTKTLRLQRDGQFLPEGNPPRELSSPNPQGRSGSSTGVSSAGRWLLRTVFVTEVTISFFTELN